MPNQIWKIKRVTSISVIAGALMFSLSFFQNCAKTNFNGHGDTSAALFAASSSGVSDGSQTGEGTPSGTSTTPTISDDQSCALAVQNQAVLFDTDPTVGPADIASVGNSVFTDLSVVAGKIDAVQNFSAQQVSLNAPTIGDVAYFSASGLEIIAHQVDQVHNFSAFACLNVQSVNSVNSLSGGVSIFGRSEGGVLAKVGSVSSLSGVVKMHSVDIDTLNGESLNGSFENSHIGTLSSGSGELVLINTVIDSVSSYAGTIHLQGSSKVGSQSDSALTIIQD